MYKITPVEYEDGTNSLTEFLKEIQEKHKGQEEQYLAPFIKVLKDFEQEGPLMNLTHSKTFPPYKKLDSINKDLAELRTYEYRYFIYKIDKFEWAGFHGYEKQSEEMPKSEKKKVKGEIKTWKEKNKKR